MQRNKFCILTLLILGGCAPKPPPEVRVDWSRIPQANLGFSPPSGPTLRGGRVQAEVSAPALPEETVTLGDERIRRERVRESVRNARLTARDLLEKRLLETYLKELNAQARRDELDLDSRRDLARKEAWESTQKLFLEYAQKRGPLLIRRNLLAEHPDRRRLNQLYDVKRRDEEAAKLQKQIEALDEEYKINSEKLYSTLEQRFAEKLTELRIEIERKRAEVVAKARAAAEAQVRQELANLDDLEDRTPALKLVPVPAIRGGVDLTLPAPTLPDIGAKMEKESRTWVRAEAEMWAAAAGYRLTENPKAPDRTQEFLEWKRSQLGPSPAWPRSSARP